MTADHNHIDRILSLRDKESDSLLQLYRKDTSLIIVGCPHDRSDKWKKRKEKNLIKVFSHPATNIGDSYGWYRSEALVRTDFSHAFDYFYHRVEDLPKLIDILSDLRVLERKNDNEMTVSVKSRTVFPINPRTATIHIVRRRLSEKKAEVVLRNIAAREGSHAGPLLKKFVSWVGFESDESKDGFVKLTQHMYVDPGLPIPSGVLEPILVQLSHNFLAKIVGELEKI